jgi:hypothetical protein
VGLPPVRRLGYDLLVACYRLVVAPEHVKGVGLEGARPALVLGVRGCLYRQLEERIGLGVVGRVESRQPCVYEHVGVLGVDPGPALEGGLRQRRLPHIAVVASELHVSVGEFRVGLDGALQVVHDLERLVAPQGHHREPHPRGYPLRVELQGIEEAGLGLL